MRRFSGAGSDIRLLGDGNVGATNAGRLMGTRWGVLIAGVDMAKGLGAISIARLLESQLCGNELEQPLSGVSMVAGACAMVGHICPIWLRFQGGRGAATAVGILGTAMPWPALIMAPPTILVLLATRNTSIGFGVFFFWSVVIARVFFQVHWLIVWYFLALLVLVVLTDPRLRIRKLLPGLSLEEEP